MENMYLQDCMCARVFVLNLWWGHGFNKFIDGGHVQAAGFISEHVSLTYRSVTHPNAAFSNQNNFIIHWWSNSVVIQEKYEHFEKYENWQLALAERQ